MSKRILIISTVGLIYDGITSVITSYLGRMDRNGLEIYVAATIRVHSDIKAEITKLGCRIIDFPSRRTDTKSYVLELSKFIRSNKIEVVHAHGNSGTLAIEMVAAWLGGCKKRIVHSHNTKCDQVKADKLLRPVFKVFYTDALACGTEAGRWLYGNRPFMVLKNGRDIDLFAYNSKMRNEMRQRYNMNDNLIIGHVGGFFEQKNHTFLVKVFREIQKIEPDAKLFLIGEGPLKTELEDQTSDISDSVVYIGTTNRVADYLQMFDGMLLPSLFEGLPLVAIEWQISGLPCLFADTVTKECAVTDTVEFLSLNDSPEVWAKKLLSKINKCKRLPDSIKAKQCVKEAGFDISDNAALLRKLYLG